MLRRLSVNRGRRPARRAVRRPPAEPGPAGDPARRRPGVGRGCRPGRLHGVRRQGSRLRDPAAALGYLRASVVNGSRSALRRRRTARGYTPPRQVEPDGPDARAVLSEEHREVLAALDQLPPRQREVLVLRYWSGLSEAEIASRARHRGRHREVHR